MNEAIAQVVAALAGGLVIVIGVAFLYARTKIEAATVAARAEKLEAETRLLKAESAKREAERLNAALVTTVEEITRPLPEAQARKTKNDIRALADAFGAGERLKATVEELGFSSKSRPSIKTPEVQ